MAWPKTVIDQLSTQELWNYPGGRESCVEPAAFAALAFLQDRRMEQAKTAAAWIASLQQRDGHVGVSESHSDPAWPTSLAIIAWRKMDDLTGKNEFESNRKLAISWALKAKGTKIDPDQSKGIGHNTLLVGWPWVIGTHSWIEPTSFFVMAFDTVGLGDHFRTRQAVRLLLDRQLPIGGCNFGNTFVLGQMLRPHPQPSGISMLALSGHLANFNLTANGENQESPNRRSMNAVRQSLIYLRQQIPKPLGPTSRCFVTLGLASHAVPTGQRELRETYTRRISKSPNAYQLALCYLASCGADSLLLKR